MNSSKLLITLCLSVISFPLLAAPFITIKEECQADNIFSDYVCEGITSKKEFYDNWFKPPMPFYVTDIESDELPENAWINPEFDSKSLDTGEEQVTSGASLDPQKSNDANSSTCPPICN